MIPIDDGVTAAEGFQAASTAAGIKYKGQEDMALVYTEYPAVMAATFTQNVFAAAPVIYDKQILKDGNPVHAVVLNTGIANAGTGLRGKETNLFMAAEMARVLDVKPSEVLTCSTGVIGYQLPEEPLYEGVKALGKKLEKSRENSRKAAMAIMTTDTVHKEAACEFTVGNKKITVGGMAKGSGMIHPDMATMLSIVTTDAKIDKDTLQELVKESVDDSFNMVSVDRDTSTNDTFITLANGKSGVEIKKDTREYETFREALRYVCITLAKKMAADGEGATRMLEVIVTGAKTHDDARKLARSVSASNLVKAMVYGADANSGRILDALGYAGVDFDPDLVDVTFLHENEMMLLIGDGVVKKIDEDKATQWMKEDKVTFLCELKQGREGATAWGCDLTHDYVNINGDYRS
ncbi:MAG: bifunctional glutamate N-acetyltransferase/amino-acid acetyltransferase ArgJ [Eubacterium sp.]|nr:bifunctional glutamate N-acetyltransferase/amino-acid acetyltransferase ArgJ [Eubacterium sp.]